MIKLLGIGVSDGDVDEMGQILGCGLSTLPFSYLGVLVGCIMSCIYSWKGIIGKFKHKLSVRKAKCLSLGGRLALIRTECPNLLYIVI